MTFSKKLNTRFKLTGRLIFRVVLMLILIVGFNNCGQGFQVTAKQISSIQSPLSADPAHTPTPAASSTPTPGPTNNYKSAGCGKTAPPSGAVDYLKIVAGGKSHDYSRIIPANYDPNEALPLVFSLHCAGLTAQQYRGAQGVSTENGANAEKAIVIYPEATVTGEWNETCGGEDMVMLQAIADMAKDNFCINTNRVFLTGFSWGADMTNAAGCCLGKTFRAVQPMSGGEMATGGGMCQTPTPAYMQTYGTLDEVYSQDSIQGIIGTYGSLQGCKSTYTMKNNCKVYDGCAHPVIDCALDGVHHTIPDDSKAKMWDFFTSFK